MRGRGLGCARGLQFLVEKLEGRGADQSTAPDDGVTVLVLEPGDVDEGLRAASAVGDDNIQKRTQGYVVPDGFTHGTAAQRQRWFKTG